jgi:hypothetical protein
MNTVWLLAFVILSTKYTDDGTIPGHVIDSGTLGYAATEDVCEKGGETLSKLFSTTGGASVIATYSCVPVSEEIANIIADAQGWEDK